VYVYKNIIIQSHYQCITKKKKKKKKKKNNGKGKVREKKIHLNIGFKIHNRYEYMKSYVEEIEYYRILYLVCSIVYIIYAHK